LKFSSAEPGVIISGVAHVALLLATLVVFSDTSKFEDAQESVPVEMITDQQFNQIMKGDKQAKEVKPTPVKADKQSEVEEKKPTPRVEAKVDIPTPPPPLKRLPDPGEDDKPETPTPPKRVAALPPEPPKPPVRPVEQKPEPPKPQDAEAIEPPKPPVRPKAEPKKVEITPPEPPKKIRPAPKEDPKPKTDDKPSLDKTALAKLLDQKKTEDKPASHPKSGSETSEPVHKFDSSAVSKLLSKEAPGQKPSTARATSQLASLGSPTASAAKMSPSMWGQLDGLLQDQYKQCWSYLALGNAQRYIPQIKVEYARDRSLIGAPVLLNPPSDPNLRSLAESALRAVRRCNPLNIPAQFTPFYDQWKSRTLRFDPEEMSG
jgi:colicin import membrane protein